MEILSSNLLLIGLLLVCIGMHFFMHRGHGGHGHGRHGSAHTDGHDATSARDGSTAEGPASETQGAREVPR